MEKKERVREHLDAAIAVSRSLFLSGFLTHLFGKRPILKLYHHLSEIQELAKRLIALPKKKKESQFDDRITLLKEQLLLALEPLTQHRSVSWRFGKLNKALIKAKEEVSAVHQEMTFLETLMKKEEHTARQQLFLWVEQSCQS